MADWAELPFDLLTRVLELMELVDQVRFGAVCKNWRSIQQNVTWLDGLPWLFVCENDYRSSSRSIFSLGGQRIYQMDFPELCSQRCCGSSQGWLITIDLKFKVHLFHPILKIQVDLPRLPEFCTDDGVTAEDIYTPEELQHIYITKAIFSGDPRHRPTECVVVIIYGDISRVAFCRVDDTRWTTIPYVKEVGLCEDIIYYNEKILAVTHDYYVVVCDIVDCKLTILDFPRINIANFVITRVRYLVEDSKGALLLIVRYINTLKEIVEAGNVDCTILPYHHALQTYYDEVRSGVFRIDADGFPVVESYDFTTKFDIFKFDSAENEWKKVECLGNQALFLGSNFSESLEVSSEGGCKPNSIYFTESFFEKDFRDVGYHDLGIYLLDEKRVEPCFPTDVFHPELTPPIWLVVPQSK